MPFRKLLYNNDQEGSQSCNSFDHALLGKRNSTDMLLIAPGFQRMRSASESDTPTASDKRLPYPQHGVLLNVCSAAGVWCREYPNANGNGQITLDFLVDADLFDKQAHIEKVRNGVQDLNNALHFVCWMLDSGFTDASRLTNLYFNQLHQEVDCFYLRICLVLATLRLMACMTFSHQEMLVNYPHNIVQVHVQGRRRRRKVVPFFPRLSLSLDGAECVQVSEASSVMDGVRLQTNVEVTVDVQGYNRASKMKIINKDLQATVKNLQIIAAFLSTSKSPIGEADFDKFAFLVYERMCQVYALLAYLRSVTADADTHCNLQVQCPYHLRTVRVISNTYY